MEQQNQRDEIAKLSREVRAMSGEVSLPLAGAMIENAQIVLMVPDNGRGPNPVASGTVQVDQTESGARIATYNSNDGEPDLENLQT